MRAVASALLIALILSVSGCVHSRWPAKTLADGVPISSKPVYGTIAQLRALPRPAGVDGFDAARVPLERQLYRLHAELLRYTLATDGDIHLALAQPGDRSATMIAEIPDPARMSGAPAQYLAEVAQTRRDFERRFGKPLLDAWRKVGRDVEITGPIFFDPIHGQVGGKDGGAANGVEIHPVLQLKFAGKK